jgi:glucose/arabinose dehydrogenase
MRFIPGKSQFLVATRDGELLHYALAEHHATLLGRFQVPEVHVELDCGLISLTFDPDFANNGFVYTGQCFSMKESGILRLRFDPSSYATIGSSAVEILRAGDPLAPRPWHNIGHIGFDPDGNLWALFGDKRVNTNGQDLANIPGSLIRIRPSTDPDKGGYEPANPPNPFESEQDADPSIYAYGLRSPWTGVLDSKGQYFFGDVGEDTTEEINVVSKPGQNFGWSLFEGACSGKECEGFTNPIVDWGRSTDEQVVIDDEDANARGTRVAWVGLEYLENQLDPYEGRLDGKVLYGDMCVGFVRALTTDANGVLKSDQHLGHLSDATGWAQAPDGYIYAVTFGACESRFAPEVGKLVRAIATDE